MVLVTQRKIKNEYTTRSPYLRDIVELRTVGKGVFLPDGAGIFADIGKALTSVGAQIAESFVPGSGASLKKVADAGIDWIDDKIEKKKSKKKKGGRLGPRGRYDMKKLKQKQLSQSQPKQNLALREKMANRRQKQQIVKQLLQGQGINRQALARLAQQSGNNKRGGRRVRRRRALMTGEGMNKKALLKLARKNTGLATLKGRKMMPQKMRAGKRIYSVGQGLTPFGMGLTPFGGRMMVTLEGRGFKDTLKKLADKGLKKAKELGRKALDVGKKEAKKQLGELREPLTEKAVGKAREFSQKGIEKLGEKHEGLSDLGVILQEKGLKQVEDLAKRGFDVAEGYLDDEDLLEGEGMRYRGPKSRGRSRPKAFNQRFTGGRLPQSNNSQSRALNQKQKQQLEYLSSKGVHSAPAFGMNRVDILNDIAIGAPIKFRKGSGLSGF